MDLMSMIANAKITDCDGNEIGTVFGIHIIGGKMTISIDEEDVLIVEEDPDGGEKIPVDKPTESENKPTSVPHLKAVESIAASVGE